MPNGILRDYLVTYYQTSLGPDNSVIATTGSDGLTSMVTGLMPFTDYSLSVTAITVVMGSESAVVTVRTNESGERAREEEEEEEEEEDGIGGRGSERKGGE